VRRGRSEEVECEVVDVHHLIISIQYIIIICNDVMRACSGEIGQNLLSRHFVASRHVCDTIEGLRLAYYDWLFDLTSVCIKSTSDL
jgi:hypothetical protein